MKKQVLCLVGVLSLLLVAGSALAQNSIVANVPFTFSVNRTTMPAGEYRISSVGTGDTLLIQSGDMKAAKLVTPNHAENLKPSARHQAGVSLLRRQGALLPVPDLGTRQESRTATAEEFLRERVAARVRSNDVPVIASAR